MATYHPIPHFEATSAASLVEGPEFSEVHEFTEGPVRLGGTEVLGGACLAGSPMLLTLLTVEVLPWTCLTLKDGMTVDCNTVVYRPSIRVRTEVI